MTTAICAECGQENSEQALHCVSCRTNIHPKGPIEAPHRPPAQPVPSPAGMKSPYHSPVAESYLR